MLTKHNKFENLQWDSDDDLLNNDLATEKINWNIINYINNDTNNNFNNDINNPFIIVEKKLKTQKKNN